MKPRIVFMGSPEFAIPSLTSLASNYPVVGVVTQPDRPAGRGRKLTPPPVKDTAIELGLQIIQPKTLRDPNALRQLESWRPDLIVVAAFGQILRENVLDLPTLKCLNVHASLLPRWRGAAPIQASIKHGDQITGATIMIMDKGIDTGPVLSQREVPVRSDDTFGTLSMVLSKLGAELLLDTLPGYITGDILPVQQDDSKATYAPIQNKKDGELDFTKPAVELERLVRACNPWPGAYMNWNNHRLIVHKASVNEVEPGSAQHSSNIGERTIFNQTPAVRCRIGLLALDEVQPAGKNRMSGRTFLLGAKNWLEYSN